MSSILRWNCKWLLRCLGTPLEQNLDLPVFLYHPCCAGGTLALEDYGFWLCLLPIQILYQLPGVKPEISLLNSPSLCFLRLVNLILPLPQSSSKDQTLLEVMTNQAVSNVTFPRTYPVLIYVFLLFTVCTYSFFICLLSPYYVPGPGRTQWDTK